MAIYFDKKEIGNPGNPDEPKKWYLYAKSIRTMTEKEVAQEIADETTLNPKEAEMALAQLKKVVLRNLKNGATVKLGDWASFNATLSSEGSATKEEAVSSKIKKVKVNIRLSPDFNAEVQKSSFVSIENFQKKSGSL